MSAVAQTSSCCRPVAVRTAALLLLAACAGCEEGSTPSPVDVIGGSGAGGAAGSGSSAAAGSGNAGNGNAAGNSGNSAGSSGAAGSGGAAGFRAPWDWAGIVGTGQSLAVGEPGPTRNTAAAALRSTTQPFNNLRLSTGSAAWPVDPNDASLSMLPLIEPVGRLATGYPSSWPTNVSGETPHSAMGNQITALVQASEGMDYISVHGEVGENGQCLSFLVKGAMPTAQNTVGGRAYEATLIETRAITRLAQAASKTYGVGAITVTHGECDAGNTSYAQQLHQLWSDYATDLAAITGQTEPPILIVSQQHASGSDRAASTLAQWKIGVDYPSEAVCSGPKYQYAYTSDAVHLLVSGYDQLGEKYGQVYYERVVMGRDWQPLQPTAATRDGRVIRVEFHVPVAPLVWEETFQAPHQSSQMQWSLGKGFEVRAANAPVGISSVEISGNAVLITCDADLPAAGVSVGYALTANASAMTTPFAGTLRWGQLRDSDPFVGSTTQQAQPNFAVAFELPVP